MVFVVETIIIPVMVSVVCLLSFFLSRDAFSIIVMRTNC